VKTRFQNVAFQVHNLRRYTAGRQQPKEVRILKYLLAMDNPQEIRSGLEEAFTPVGVRIQAESNTVDP
jgi:hypothetical protein